MSQPFKLYRLQLIDTQIDQARARLQEVEKSLKDESALRQAQAKADESMRRLDESRKALKRAEEEVRTVRIKMEQTDASLYGGKVRNPKELQDLQNESAALKRHISVLEDKQLENMLEVEEAEATNKAENEALQQVKSSDATQKSLLNGTKNELLKALERLEGERQSFAGSIPPEDINLYDQLRQQRRGVAVATVQDSACGACGSTLTPAQIQASHSASQITRCTFCGRILYAG